MSRAEGAGRLLPRRDIALRNRLWGGVSASPAGTPCFLAQFCRYLHPTRVSHAEKVNLGLRWDYESPITEQTNQVNNVCRSDPWIVAMSFFKTIPLSSRLNFQTRVGLFNLTNAVH